MSGITFVLPGLEPTGGYRTLIEWANRLAADGLRVTVVSPSDGAARQWIGDVVDVRAGGRPARLVTAIKKRANAMVGATSNLVLDPLLCAPLIPVGGHVILGFAPYNRRLLLRQPAITYMQHWEPIWYRGDERAIRLAERRMLDAAPGIVNSTWLLRQFPAPQQRHLHLVYPGVDCELFTPASPRRFDRRRVRIAALGREEPFKGLANLRNAAAQLSLPVDLFLFGPKPHTNASTEDMSEMHVGQLTQPELANLYRSVDLVVTPSWCESFPLPPLEAMATGAIVVTSRQGTEDYAVNKRNAFVFDGGNVVDLKRALEEAIEQLANADDMRHEARATAEQFTWAAGYVMFVESLQKHGVMS